MENDLEAHVRAILSTFPDEYLFKAIDFLQDIMDELSSELARRSDGELKN